MDPTEQPKLEAIVSGPPDDLRTTTWVRGLDEARRKSRRAKWLTLVVGLSTVFLAALAAGQAEIPWYWALTNSVMVGAGLAAAYMGGQIVGHTRVLVSLAEARVTVKVYPPDDRPDDRPDDTPDDTPEE